MRISEEGQIIIPKHLREYCGFTSDVEVQIVLADGGLLIRKRPEHDPIDAVYGILGEGGSTDEYMSEIRGYDYAAELHRYNNGS